MPSLISSQPDAQNKSPRILVLRAGAIGDTLMVTPLLRALRRTFPEAYLAFVCSQTVQEVLRSNPHLDRVMPLAYRHLPSWLSGEKRRLVREMRELNLDWAIVLEGHPQFVELALQARPKRLIAYGPVPSGDGFTRAVFDPQRHSIDNYLSAAEPLGVRPAGREMELPYPAEMDEAVRQRLANYGVGEADCVVGIHPGWGGRKHPIDQTRLRSWPAERFAQVVGWLVKTEGVRVALTGSAADRPLTEYIAREAGVACLNLAGEFSLLELAALIRRFDLYLTVDSGPAHMAAALGTPLVTLWGPGIYAQTSPQAGASPVRIIDRRVHCAPCYGTPLMKTCKDNICMKQIEVEEVTKALASKLDKAPAREGKAIQPQSGLRPPA
ncbi:MAG: glycosyltransferase family 9 protein [Acidobacteriia bacterium]|nr:glycosyltransferase family 9 protein [Terriglobia bacterium]